MAANKPWIVCETTGRWAAALRVAMARHATNNRANLPTRIVEVRTLAELASTARDRLPSLQLVEVDFDNFAAALAILARDRLQGSSMVAALGESMCSSKQTKTQTRNRCSEAIDALLEAGATLVLESPRHVSRLFALAKVLDRRTQHTASDAALSSIAASAWAALPWQDA